MIRSFLASIVFLFHFFPAYIFADNIQKRDMVMIADGACDVLVEVTEQEFTPITKKLGIEIGGEKFVELDYLDSLLSKFKPIKISFGGSAANSAYILSSLGKNNGIYTTSSDEVESIGFIKHLEGVGIENHGPYMSKEVRGNNSVIMKIAVFITGTKTDSAERTFIKHKGYFASNFSKAKPDLSHIKNYKILYIEGYAFSPNSKDIIFEAIQEAKQNNVKVLFAPSSPFFANRYREEYKKIIDLSDIVFTNRAEVKALYQNDDIDAYAKKLAGKVDIAIVTNGKEGSEIYSNYGKDYTKIYEHLDQSKVVDTTGAGDSYLAGFLHGYLDNHDIKTSGKMGAIVANYIIQESSGIPSKKMLQEIKAAMAEYN